MPHAILLHEDNATIRELVSAILVDEGYAVREAGELAEADALVGEGGRVPMIVFTAHRLLAERCRLYGPAAPMQSLVAFLSFGL
jgi:CheY-like chemotaxis protein